MLSPLVKHWLARGTMVVSFKLETDSAILLDKARKALATYGHTMVVANLLHDRKRRVQIVRNTGQVIDVQVTPQEVDSGTEIEEKIIAFLVDHHDGKSQATETAAADS